MPIICNGEYVSPDTPSVVIVEKEAPKLPKAPPECVSKILEVIYEAQKVSFKEKKAFSTSLFDLHVASKIGLGCTGWDIPEIKITYGGTGYTATMLEQASHIKWTINQDKSVFLDISEAAPMPAIKK